MGYDLSNKSLSSLLVITIVVVIATTMVMLAKIDTASRTKMVITGYASSVQGTANITINTSLSITLINSTVDFGTCTPGGTTIIAKSNESEPANCTGGDYPNGEMTLENNGNVNASINISSDVNATDLLQPSTSGDEHFDFAGAGTGCTTGLVSSWTEFTQGSSQYSICSNLPAGNLMNIVYQLDIPSTSASGTHVATITFTASQA